MDEAGKDVLLEVNPRTRRFTLVWPDNGDPEFSDSEVHAVLGRLFQKKGRYWADTTGREGSTLHEITEDRVGTESAIKSAAEGALAPLLEDGRLTSLTAEVTRTPSNIPYLSVTWSTPDGEQDPIEIPLPY